MLVLWLSSVWRALLRVVLPPPPDAQPIALSTKTRCKGCGYKGSTLAAVRIVQGQSERTVIRQECARCGATYDWTPVGGASAIIGVSEERSTGPDLFGSLQNKRRM